MLEHFFVKTNSSVVLAFSLKIELTINVKEEKVLLLYTRGMPVRSMSPHRSLGASDCSGQRTARGRC
jgi:hypothetical protein